MTVYLGVTRVILAWLLAVLLLARLCWTVTPACRQCDTTASSTTSIPVDFVAKEWSEFSGVCGIPTLCLYYTLFSFGDTCVNTLGLE